MFAKVKFEVTAGFVNDFLNYLAEKQIEVSDIERTTFGFLAVCRAQDYKTVSKAGKKFQCRVRIAEKKGIYFLMRKPLKRMRISI